MYIRLIYSEIITLYIRDASSLSNNLVKYYKYVCLMSAVRLSSVLCSWKSIIDHLLTHEKTMFKDLMSEYSS